MTTLESLAGPRTPGIFNTIEYGLAPRRFALRHEARYGRVFRVRSARGDVVCTTVPEHLRRIFSADSDAFMPLSAASLRGILGSQSVLVTSGATHKRQRKLLVPPLIGTRLRDLGMNMQRLADRHVSKLKPGQSFRALDFTTAFTLDVIVTSVFGGESDAEVAELGSLLHALVYDVPPIAIFAPRLQRPWFSPWAKYTASQSRFDAWLADKIAQRRRSDARGRDVLSLLLEARFDDGSTMTDAEIRDQLVGLMLAGHETTAVTLATCLGRVHRSPEILARVRAEIDAAGEGPEQVQRLPYLSAVIDETLRIDPVLTDVARVPKADFALDAELVVTANQIVLVLIEGLHHNRQLYPNPTTFRPERFLERTFTPYEYAPFGGGVRRCLGAAFSDYETKILLSTVFRRTELRLENERAEPRVRRTVTMGPQRGVPMRVVALR